MAGQGHLLGYAHTPPTHTHTPNTETNTHTEINTNTHRDKQNTHTYTQTDKNARPLAPIPHPSPNPSPSPSLATSGEEDKGGAEGGQIRGYALDTIQLHHPGRRRGAHAGKVLHTFHTSRRLHHLIPCAAVASAPMSSTITTTTANAVTTTPPVIGYTTQGGSSTNLGSSGNGNAKSGGGHNKLPSHNEAAGGAGWGNDEHSIFKGLFDSMDVRKTGLLTRDQFLRCLRHDQRSRYWLRRTFLWSLYKARRWSLLLDMFEPDPRVALSFKEFTAFLQQTMLEKGVPEAQVPREAIIGDHGIDEKGERI